MIQLVLKPLNVKRFLVVLFLFACKFVYSQPVNNGVADFSTFNINDGPFYLYGQWEFYWNQLRTPEDIDNYKGEFIKVPGSWHKHASLPLLGYATYRVKVKLPSPFNPSILYFPIINASAKIWVNKKLIHENGRVGINDSTYKAKLSTIAIPLAGDLTECDVIIQVANYSYFSSGLTGTPQINTAAQFFSEYNNRDGVENFFAGSLVAMCIYQLILYFLYHRGKAYLWLALICLGVALRTMIVHGGTFLLPNLFPAVSWEIWKKIEFGFVYLIGCLFPLYIYDLFKEYAPRRPLYFFTGISVILLAFVLVTPQYVYGLLLEVCHVTLLLGFVYAVYSIVKAWKNGNSDAKIIFTGVIISFPFILLEILQNSRLFPIHLNFRYMVELGVLVFLLFQVYLLAYHFANSYRNLEHMNVNLEKMVEERSGELITANSVKDRLLSVMSHDIKSPLNSLRGILQLYNQGIIKHDEFNTFAVQVENELNKTSMLLENILFWTSSQMKGIQVNMEVFNLYSVVKDIASLYDTISSQKNIRIVNEIPSDLTVESDKNILNLVFRNVVSNAVKFSYEGGAITIRAAIISDKVKIDIMDTGVGINKEVLNTLLAPEVVVSSTGTKNEKGSGLGLALCKQYLAKVGGELNITSEKGKGSTFTIFIPDHVHQNS